MKITINDNDGTNVRDTIHNLNKVLSQYSNNEQLTGIAVLNDKIEYWFRITKNLNIIIDITEVDNG